jgi:hypothetical protein
MLVMPMLMLMWMLFAIRITAVEGSANANGELLPHVSIRVSVFSAPWQTWSVNIWVFSAI